MNSQQDVIYGLINELEDALDKGFPLLGYHFTVVKKDTVTNILDKLYAALPDEIKEARALLRRKDEFQYEAQQRAEKIISDAQAEANRLLSESDLLRAVQKEAEKIKEQVIADCEEIKRRALEEADAVTAVSKTRIPILLIHGENDNFVPCSMSREIYAACASPATLVTVPDAGHGMSYLTAPEIYEQAVTTFIADILI